MLKFFWDIRDYMYKKPKWFYLFEIYEVTQGPTHFTPFEICVCFVYVSGKTEIRYLQNLASTNQNVSCSQISMNKLKEKKATSNTKHTPVSGLWGIYYVFLTLWTQGWLGLIFFLLNQFLIMGYHDSKCIAFRWSSSKKINCKKQPYLLPWFHWDIAFLLRFAKQTTTGLWCWGVLAPWSSHSLTVTWSIVCNGD